MSDYEEDFGDFPSENKTESKESLVGAYRAESTFDFSAGSGITTQIPPLFDGSTSWFKYEELIEDLLDFTFTVLEETKRRPALKNRLVGDAEMFIGLPNPESPRATDGVKYFRNTLRPHFKKGAHNVYFWRFYKFNRERREIFEMVKWIGRFWLFLQRWRGQFAVVRFVSEEQRRISILPTWPKKCWNIQ